MLVSRQEDRKLKKIEARRLRKERKNKERELKKKERLEKKKKLEEERLKKKLLKEKGKTSKKESKSATSPGMSEFIVDKEKAVAENPILDDDITKVLAITDDLLGNLPEEIINEFVKSKDFEIYERVMNKYKIK